MRSLNNCRPVRITKGKNSSFKIGALECAACYVRDAPDGACAMGSTDSDFFRGDGTLEAVQKCQTWLSHGRAVWVVRISGGVMLRGNHGCRVRTQC